MTTIRRVVAGASPQWMWTQNANGVQYVWWYGECVGWVVFSNKTKMYNTSHIAKCGPPPHEGGHRAGKSTNLSEAKKMAMTCPKCGDMPCEYYTEPTEETPL